MKKIFFIGLLILASVLADAQLSVNLLTSPTPPSTVSEWATRKEVITYLVNSRQGAIKQVKIKCELQLTDGTVVAATDLANAPLITLIDGNNLFYAAEVFPVQHMMFLGKYKTILQNTGKLISENYQLCVTLVNPVDYGPVSEVRCRNFYVASLQLPIAVMPASESVLPAEKARTAIIFRWTPVTPRPASPVVYHIQVFEILPGQTPMQAFRSNLPVANQSITGTTQFIWQPQLSLLPFPNQTDSIRDNSKLTFIWTIQATDTNGLPLGDGAINADGRSEPSVFYVSNQTIIPVKKKKKE
jgi:hypothetical protein